MTQKILFMFSDSSGIRSEATGWSAEDPNRFHEAAAKSPFVNLHDHSKIGLIGGDKSFHCYGAPLLALADNWKLLAPPTMITKGIWEWYFTKEVK